MKKRMISILLSLVILVGLLPSLALPTAAVANVLDLVGPTPSTDDDYFYLKFKWNTDDAVGGGASNTNINNSYISVEFGSVSGLSVISKSGTGWRDVSTSGTDELNFYFQPELMENLNAKAEVVVKTRSLPCSAELHSSVGSQRGYGGSMSIFLCDANGANESSQIGKVQVGQKTYTTVDHFSDSYHGLSSLSLSGDGNYTLPMASSVTEDLNVSVLTTYGIDGGQIDKLYGNYAGTPFLHNAYYTYVSATPASGVSISTSPGNGKCILTVSPSVYDSLGDAASLTIGVTVRAVMKNQVGVAKGNEVSIYKELKFDRPVISRLQQSAEGLTFAWREGDGYYRMEQTAQVTPLEGYGLPDSVTVKRGEGSDYSTYAALPQNAFTYEPETGLVTIPAGEVTGNLLLIAEAHKHEWSGWSHVEGSDPSKHIHTCTKDSSHTETADCVFSSTTVAPTETALGYTRHTCDKCGYYYDDAETKVQNTITDLTMAGWTYGEAASEPAVTATYSGSSVTYTYADAEDGAYTSEKPVNPGTYWVKATVVGTDFYDSVSETASFTIAKATLTPTAAVTTEKTYDGTTSAAASLASFAGKVGSDDVGVSVSAAYEEPDVAGDDFIVVSYALTGADAWKYELSKTSERISGSILPLDIGGAAITLSPGDVQWTGTAQTQSVTAVTVNGLTVPAADYQVSGHTGTDVGSYNLSVEIIKQDSNFTGTAATRWCIDKADGPAAPDADESFALDLENETITIESGYEVWIGGVQLQDGDSISDYTGQTITVYKSETATHRRSEGLEVTIPARPAAPAITAAGETIRDKGDGKVTGITAGLEYKINDGAWQDGPTVPENLPAGTSVTARVKATQAAPHGEETVVTVAASTVTLSVSFEENGGSGVADVTGLSWHAQVTPPATTRSGYTFDGWFDAEGGKLTAATQIETNITYYAKWTLNSPAVSGTGYTGTYDAAAHTVSVTASHGDSTAAFTYQWYKGGMEEGSKLSGQTGSTLNVKNVADSGTYYCKVTSAADGQTASEFVAVTVSIAPRALTVTAVDQTITYGDAAPDYTVTYTGFAAGEDKNVLDGTLSLTCAYEQFDDVGIYAIVPAGLSARNYAITFVQGTLTVNQKEVGLAWSGFTAEQLIYSRTAKTMTAEATGLVNGDSCAVTVELVGDNVNVGTFRYRATALSNSNYKLPANVLSPAHTITPKAVTITALNQRSLLGLQISSVAVENVNYTMTGLIEGDSIGNVKILLREGTRFVEPAHVMLGTYDIVMTVENPNPNYAITFVDGTLVCYMVLPGQSTLPFTDVAGDAWYRDAVQYVYDEGLMTGTAYDRFSPDLSTSRAMIVTILWRLEGAPMDAETSSFTDVVRYSWYSDAVDWAAAFGIVEGYSEESFGPNDPITREQLAAILYRYARYKGYDVSVGENTNILSYEDAFDVSDYAYPALQWACGAGVMNGTNGYLLPQSHATRAQTAAILYRFLQ